MGLVKGIECFKIQVFKTKENIFDLKNADVIKTLLCDSSRLIREPKTIIADPFLFVSNGYLYLFLEDKMMYKKGKISMIRTNDMVHWSEPVVVLEESCHLSYPWVFEEDGHIYMVPETSNLHAIRLYEADNKDLTSFSYKKTILENKHTNQVLIDYSDSSIFKNENGYFLMTTVNVDGINQLELFFSKRLFGPYTEHDRSPVAISNKYGRNAGCIFLNDGVLYRPAQDCEQRYGDAVHLLWITELSENQYQEKAYINNLFSEAGDFYREGGHQFNCVSFNGYTIIATDAKEYHTFLIQRLLHKLRII